MRLGLPLASALASVMLAGGLARAASLDFEARVEAHRAVERVLWERRIWPESNPGPKPALEDVLPESVLRTRVEDVLRKSRALEDLWKRPIGSVDLKAELDRMIGSSRDPATLQAMFDALGRDPVLAGEAIARPALVDRLIRSWYAGDSRYHGEGRRRAEEALASAGTPEALARAAARYETRTWARGAGGLDGSEWSDLLDKIQGQTVGTVGRLHESETAYSATVVLARTENSVQLGVASWPKTLFDVWWPVERPAHPPMLVEPAQDAP